MSFRLVLGAWVVLSVLTALPAFAQSTRRPDLNPFGRGFRESSQSLSASGSLGATFFDVIERRTAPVEGQQLPDHGWGSFVSGSLGYRLSFPKLSFDASLGATASYYPALGTSVRTRVVPVGGTGLGYTFDLSENTTLRVSSSAGFRPAYAERLWAGGFGGRIGGRDGVPDLLPPDSTLIGGSYLSLDGGAGLRHQFSRRWSGTADYGYGQDFLFEDEDAPERRGRRSGWTQRAGAALHFLVTRNLSVRGGYRFTERHFDVPNDGATAARPAFRTHSADIGIDYGQGNTIELGRDTTMTFSFGLSSFVNDEGRQRYRLGGGVGLTHLIGRTWTGSVNYARGVSSGEVLFQEPVLRDTVTGLLNGLLSRRVGAHVIARASHGQVGLRAGDNGHVSIAASAGLQMALHQQMALSVDYTYYQYRLGAEVIRPSALSDRSASQGVHAYLSLWAPIFQRRPDAAR